MTIHLHLMGVHRTGQPQSYYSKTHVFATKVDFWENGLLKPRAPAVWVGRAEMVLEL
mgnify:CR=1 FL=1